MEKLSYSKRKYLTARIKLILILLFMIAILIFNVSYGIKWNSLTIRTFELLFVFSSGFAFYPLLMLASNKLDKVEDKILNDAKNARLGIEGEDTVTNWLKQILDNKEYIILPNLVLPGHHFDIDFVVIGPKGIILLEVKNHTGKYQYSNDEYYQIKNGNKIILPPNFDPREEVKKHSYYLRKYFEFNGYNDIRILKAVVLIDEKSVIIEGNTGIYIASGFDSLKKFLDNTTSDIKYTPEFCEKLRQVLVK